MNQTAEQINLATLRFRLSDILKEREITQRRLAEMTGISESGISNLVSAGLRQIRLETIALLCFALDLRPGDLFEYEFQAEKES